MLKLYNYLTRKKEEFRPLQKGRVGLYTCGPTVYNFVHIGNLRTYVFEDVLRRALAFHGWRVKHVMNLTDVDDKTIRGAMRAGKGLKEFTGNYARSFFRDIAALNTLPAGKYTKATEHIRPMVALIRTLLRKKIAYRADDGIYFSIRKFKPYGKLSRVRVSGLRAGARVATDEYDKKNIRDFALWKFKKPGEPSWKAPFGEGRPGWHIECSAMSMQYLGKTFDIHAGAIDLLFPHHEDEIAQSEAATGKTFVRFFVEGEHLMVDGKKMAKSLGNVYTLRDLEAQGYDPLDFRYLVLGTHYRTPLNFTGKGLDAARTARGKLAQAIASLRTCVGKSTLKEENEVLKVIAHGERKFRDAIADDLNTPKGLAVLHELVHYANSIRRMGHCSERTSRMLVAAIAEFDRVLGLRIGDVKIAAIPEDIQKLVAQREQTRKQKQWQESDRLRAEIQRRGYRVEDTSRGTRIRRQ